MDPITTRAARAADAPEITEMIRALGAYHNDRAMIAVEDLIFLCFGPTPWMSLIVAEQGGQVCGYAALQRKVQLQFARRLMDVQHLFVKPDARGQGVGRILMAAAVEAALAQRCVGVSLGVMVQNQEAQRFYDALGFEHSATSGAIQLLLRLDSHPSMVKPESMLTHEALR